MLSSAVATGTVGQGNNVSVLDAVTSVLQAKNSFYLGGKMAVGAL